MTEVTTPHAPNDTTAVSTAPTTRRAPETPVKQDGPILTLSDADSGAPPTDPILSGSLPPTAGSLVGSAVMAPTTTAERGAHVLDQRVLGARTASRYRAPIVYDAPAEERRVGVVVPFDFALDWEYWRYLPDGVNLHFTRTPHLQRDDGMYLAKACGRPSVVARAARSLLSIEPHSVLYACTSGSFVRGVAGEAELRAAMTDAGCANPVTSSGAAVEALRRSGARRVAVVAPYSGRLTRLLADFVDESGFEVVAAHYLGLHRGIAPVSQTTIMDLVRQTAGSGADAVFVSCTSLRTFGIVAQLEQELGVPVFTSNQVSLWAALEAADALADRGAAGRGPWVLGDGDPPARSTLILLDHLRLARPDVA